jgi:radical SAM protein with 4Fe4S-binding SPASM domain
MHIDTIKFYGYQPYPKTQFQNKFCWLPYKSMLIDADGDVMLCNCQSYMPYVIGNIYQQSIKEIWHNEKAQQVRDSVLQSQFTYCSTTCSLLYNKLVDTPVDIPQLSDFPPEVILDFDTSCNLKCPSCREHVIIEKNNQKILAQNKIFDSIIDHATIYNSQTIVVKPISSGEIFASHSGLAFLKKLQLNPRANIKLHISSNGTLIYQNRDWIKTLLPRIERWAISIDAASQDVYQMVRGGDWQALIKGLDLLKSFEIKNLQFNFVVQRLNYQQIEQFADMGHAYGAKIHFQPLENWGHWNKNWWAENQVDDSEIIGALENVVNKYGATVAIPYSIAQKIKSNTP